MIHVYIFNTLQAVVCLYALLRGGRPERWTAIMLFVASVATYLVPFDPATSFRSVDMAGLVIDLALMAGLVVVAAVANRFWPLWLAALHLLAIGVHGVRGLDPGLMPWMYAVAAGKLAYPMILVLALGVMRHQRRLALYGHDPDWSLSWREPRDDV
ncbi:hypothetical protein [Sphingomonas sp. SORGH_AS_0879]|uniref:hypothetical protein n=1 Tax=Sphingomonas sp. SORGH_AS_0879 TaxID=3041790 RepID=UPI0027892B3E|nr:hypothetical protein [Sphingomonas sp. SORGH_AS_0879]MDQ1229984.1 hypothetical protein [Sphingomonas sp. SORGH_AS_0879]